MFHYPHSHSDKTFFPNTLNRKNQHHLHSSVTTKLISLEALKKIPKKSN